jgi:hypothetical protein
VSIVFGARIKIIPCLFAGCFIVLGYLQSGVISFQIVIRVDDYRPGHDTWWMNPSLFLNVFKAPGFNRLAAGNMQKK